MRRAVLLASLIVVSSAAFAGVTYDFKSVTTGRGGTTLAGAAAIEGTKMRMDFQSGDGMIFKNNTSLISRDGGKTFLVLDPSEKSYYEFSLEALFQTASTAMKAMGNLVQMSVSNQKVDVKDLGEAEKIEGFTTRKFVVTSTYDMSMKIMGATTTSRNESLREVWVTNQIPIEHMTFIQEKGFKTGIEDLDKFIAAQAGPTLKGFPLRQITTTKSSSGKRSETNVNTTTISNYKTGPIPASRFEVPAGYEQKEAPTLGIPNMPQ